LTGAPVVIGSRIEEVESAFAPLFPVDPDRGVDPVTVCFDRFVADGDTLPLGHLSMDVMSTPGHTPACSTYVIGDAAFVGDTLFMPDYGTARTDFPGGSAPELYRSIQRILSLPANTRLYLCHDYKAPGRDEFAWETTVAEQRAHNIHIRSGTTEQEFVDFRTHRDQELAVPKLLLPSVQVNLRAGNLPKAAQNGVQYLRIPLNRF
jgi:glyoxylase-like metal-dependent hydrolase (beta-lactamase superfamily II)